MPDDRPVYMRDADVAELAELASQWARAWDALLSVGDSAVRDGDGRIVGFRRWIDPEEQAAGWAVVMDASSRCLDATLASREAAEASEAHAARLASRNPTMTPALRRLAAAVVHARDVVESAHREAIGDPLMPPFVPCGHEAQRAAWRELSDARAGLGDAWHARAAGAPPEPAAPTFPPGDDAPPVDFAALASALRKARKPTQARLVEHMADRSEALTGDVAWRVHGDADADEKAVRANVRRTNDSLAVMGSPLAFEVASGRVFRAISRK